MQTPQEARELRDVQLRVDHLDQLGIDVQVMYNTMWIEQVTDQADAEIALCASWNRWMADVWKQGGGTPPLGLRGAGHDHERGAASRSASPGRTARWASVCGRSKVTGTWWIRTSTRSSTRPSASA